MQPSPDRGQVESQLLACVKRLERNYYDWRAVHLHLSQLKAQNRRHYQLRVAASEFDVLLRKFNSELFQLGNGDIVFLWHGGSLADVDPVVLRLRYLFSDDPLANAANAADHDHSDLLAGATDQGPVNGKLCTWFELRARVRPAVPASRGAGRVPAGRLGRPRQQRRAAARSRRPRAARGQPRIDEPVRPDPPPVGLCRATAGRAEPAVQRALCRDPRSRQAAAAGRRSDRRHLAVPAAGRIPRSPAC